MRASLLAALVSCLGIGLTAEAEAVERRSDIAKPLMALAARSAPSSDAPRVMTVAVRAPITGSATRLLVRERATDAEGHQWLRVLLPERGTGQLHTGGRSGWVERDRVQLSQTLWALHLDRARRQVTVRRAGAVVRRYRVVVGAPSTPTPAGLFQLTEIVRQPRGTATGPYVLATNAYSGVLTQFAGGPGQVGLHGRTGLQADPLGSAKSHGCVRFDDRAIIWLARTVSAGTPLIIE